MLLFRGQSPEQGGWGDYYSNILIIRSGNSFFIDRKPLIHTLVPGELSEWSIEAVLKTVG
jgi:hypothetical protein